MDEKSGPATIFISYSHTARQQMLVFRKHLEGLLFGRAKIWSDQAIPRGEKWESRLLSHLKLADAALVLVTPDFLASRWCRRELEHIASMQKTKDMKRVFWVQLEPSGWRQTELVNFQAWGPNLDQALSEISDNSARARAIASICEELAGEVLTLNSQLDNDLVFVRHVIEDQALEKGLVVYSSLPEGRGAFATVCRGRKGTSDVAIKVVRRSQVKHLSETFDETLEVRKRLTNQCFIKVLDHFRVDAGNEQYTVVVEEFVGSDAERLDKYLEKSKCSIDEVATAVRRAAEALNQFHDRPPVGESSYGLLSSKQVYYDRRSQKLLVPAIGVSNFLWLSLGWERFCAWQDEGDNAAAYVSPEEAEGKPATKRTDQYRLGQIAFEMLEGKLPFDVRRPREVSRKEDFWNDPSQTVTGQWAQAHQAFAKIIFRMLRRDPEKRWESFDELIMRLRTMEDESRALAKRTYEGLEEPGFRLKENGEFFRSFYREFFQRAPDAEEKFDKRKVDQHKKLMDAMVAVLNFRAGNEPTALREIVAKHLVLKKAITVEEVDKFVETFVDTLEMKLPRKMPKRDRDRIITAWRDLFSPAAEYFKEELEKAAQTTGARR